MIQPRRSARLALLLVASTACSRSDFNMESGISEDESTDLDLRLDVLPSEGTFEDGEVRLLAQSFGGISTGIENLDLQLAPAVQLSGRISGFKANPYRDGSIPGEIGPIEARLRFVSTGGGRAVTASTDSDGRYKVDLVAGDYEMQVVPVDGEIAPGNRSLRLLEPDTVNVELAPGTPVWGNVVDASGRPVSGARLQAIRDDGLASSELITDDTGSYLLRLPPGDWSLFSEGRETGTDPVVQSADFSLADLPVPADLVFPSMQFANVGGRVLDKNGDPIGGLRVRFDSIALEGEVDPAASLITASTSTEGLFYARLHRGTYAVSITPDDGQRYTPVSLGELELTGTHDLGDTTLFGLRQVTATLRDPSDAGVTNAVLRCVEAGPGDRSFQATSDEFGDLDITLPQIPMDCELVPPGVRKDIALTRFSIDASQTEIAANYDRGVPVGGVLTFDSAPEPYAVLELRDDDDTLWATALSDSDGVFQMRVTEER